MKQIIFLISLMMISFANSAPPTVKPTKYYIGETVTFTLTYGESDTLPTDVDLKYESGDTTKPFGTCTADEKVITCADVKIETTVAIPSLTITSDSTLVYTLIVADGQDISSSTSIEKGTNEEATFTFAEEYDLAPQIDVKRGDVIIKGTGCKLSGVSSTKEIKCSYTLPKNGKYKIIYNGVASTKFLSTTIPAEPLQHSPKNYYIGETVAYTFTYFQESEVPEDKDLKYIIDLKDVPFATCIKIEASLSCPNVKIDTEETDLSIKNSDPTPVFIFKFTSLKGQALSSIDPKTIEKDKKKEVILTFAKEYDLVPVIKAKGTATKDATDCSITDTATEVKCSFTLDKEENYTIVYNGVETKIELAVSTSTEGSGKILTISFSLLLLAYLF